MPRWHQTLRIPGYPTRYEAECRAYDERHQSRIVDLDPEPRPLVLESEEAFAPVSLPVPSCPHSHGPPCDECSVAMTRFMLRMVGY